MMPKYFRGYIFPIFKGNKYVIDGTNVKVGTVMFYHVFDDELIYLPFGPESPRYQEHLDRHLRGSPFRKVESKTEFGYAVRTGPETLRKGRLQISVAVSCKKMPNMLSHLAGLVPNVPLPLLKVVCTRGNYFPVIEGYVDNRPEWEQT